MDALMCLFCRAFEVMYGVDADVALNPDRWREFDEIPLGGASSDRTVKKDKRRYARQAKRRAGRTT